MIDLGNIIFAGRDWSSIAIAGGIVLISALIWNLLRGSAGKWFKVVCALLKLAGVLVLLACLLEPLWTSQRAKPGANLFGIIADNSQSMSIKEPAKPESRGDDVRHELTDAKATWPVKLEETFQLRRYLFDSRLQSVKDFSELKFQGSSSALGAALRTAAENWRGQPAAGLLLFTDGNATDLADDLSALENCPPVFPVLPKDQSEVSDLALQKVGLSQTAFEDAPVTVQANVSATGLNGADVVSWLTEVAVESSWAFSNSTSRVKTASGLEADSKQSVNGDVDELNFRFQFQPDKPGIHFYELQTRLKEERTNPNAPQREATLVNNRRMIAVDRGQEPFRVLYVSGRPNWEYKFLNRAVQEDSQVQMVSLIRVARREPKFQFKGRPGESSNPLFRGFDRKDEETARYDQPVIIRLNTKDELELRGGFPKTAEELFRYHAVILDDLEAEFFTQEQMSLLQRFVAERGGGFLMLGGAESFREGNFAGTPVASLLPVYVDREVKVELPAQWKLDLTREGWLQPWTRLHATEAEDKSRLEAMPAFETFHAVGGVKPGASVLATVSDFHEQTFPALVVQRFGAGRSAALTIGDFWRWGLQDEAKQKDLGKCWRQLVRWLVADVPGRFGIAAERPNAGAGSEVRLVVKARDPEIKPLDNATVSLKVRAINAAASTNHTNTAIHLLAEPSADSAGVYEAGFVAREPGAYLAEATIAGPDGKTIGHAAVGWTCEPDVEEFRSLRVNRTLLENIARRTGGQVIAPGELETFVRDLPNRRAPITESVSSPLWHRPEVFLLALGCFVAEWGLRRWKGLP